MLQSFATDLNFVHRLKHIWCSSILNLFSCRKQKSILEIFKKEIHFQYQSCKSWTPYHFLLEQEWQRVTYLMQIETLSHPICRYTWMKIVMSYCPICRYAWIKMDADLLINTTLWGRSKPKSFTTKEAS